MDTNILQALLFTETPEKGRIIGNPNVPQAVSMISVGEGSARGSGNRLLG